MAGLNRIWSLISALALSVSIAVNADATETLESVGYPDGRILTSAQLPVSNVADCWQVKDHLGNVRVLFCLNSEGYMPVLEVNDYLPFGSRIQDSSLSAFSLNRYRYAGKEEHDNFIVCDNLNNLALSANDFGARFQTPFLGSWTSPDPLSSKYASSSPYAYCANNPINYIDPDGKSTWVIQNADGTYKIVAGGDPEDDDDNIYVTYTDINGNIVKCGSIGRTATPYSFYNHDTGRWAENSIIDLSDESGSSFLSTFYGNDRPNLFSYITILR
jgi:RHS repeat-associated protein